MCPGFRDHPPLPRRRSGSIRDRKIDVPGVDRSGRPLKILLVDDAPVNLAVSSRLLGRMGCQVEPATSGDYALALFRDGSAESSYDLILVDMNMPGMNGMDTCRAIREIEADFPEDHPNRNRKVPILILTSFNPGDKLAEFRRAGANDFLYKPIEPEVLREALSKWVPVHA